MKLMHKQMQRQLLSRSYGRFSFATLCLVIVAALCGMSAAAQGKPAAHSANGVNNATKERAVKFEVASIRPVAPSANVTEGLGGIGPTKNGYDSGSTSIYKLIVYAYGPPGDIDIGTIFNVQVLNAPKWLTEPYAVKARVSNGDLVAWQNQSGNHELFRSALRSLLKERCKLAIHEQPREVEDFKLVVGKKGAKLKATAPGSALPSNGIKLPSGGVQIANIHVTAPRTEWDFYGATTGDIARFLSNASPGRPVHDMTGLTGRYDFKIASVDEPSHSYAEQLSNWPIGPLGLELKPGKSTTYSIVIDHVEKPTPN